MLFSGTYKGDAPVFMCCTRKEIQLSRSMLLRSSEIRRATTSRSKTGMRGFLEISICGVIRLRDRDSGRCRLDFQLRKQV